MDQCQAFVIRLYICMVVSRRVYPGRWLILNMPTRRQPYMPITHTRRILKSNS
jgi:hypothetical protein